MGLYAGAIITLGGAAPAGTPSSYTDILFHWNAENSLDADKGTLTASNTGMTFPSASPSPAVSTYSLGRTTAEDRCTFTLVEGTHIDKHNGQIGFWYNYSSSSPPGNNEPIFKISYDASNVIQFQWMTGGDVYLKYVGQATTDYVLTASDYMSADTWYFIVGMWNVGAVGDDLDVSIYDAAGSLVGSSAGDASITEMDGAADGANMTLLIGENSADTWIMYWDNIIVSTDASRNMVAVRATTNFN